MERRHVLMPAAAIALLAVAAVGWFRPGRELPPAPPAPDEIRETPRTIATASSTPSVRHVGDRATHPYPQPAHPWQDTDVDGDVTVDDSGHFVPDPRALQLFAYFFIESGRLDDEEIRLQIRQWLNSRLEEPALSEALAFLERYLTLRQLAAQAHAAGMPAELRSRLALIRELQRRAFGQSLADQLFGEENRRRAAQVDKLEALARGETVDPTAGMSAAEARVYQRTRSALDAGEMAAATDDPVLLWHRRSEVYGYEAAYRLAELDQRRDEWAERLSAWRRERDALSAAPDLGDGERRARQQELLARYFSATEQRRVFALERIAAAEAGDGS